MIIRCDKFEDSFRDNFLRVFRRYLWVGKSFWKEEIFKCVLKNVRGEEEDGGGRREREGDFFRGR